MAVHRTEGQPEYLADLPGEIAFAPKELRLANELSERLGYTTVRSPSRSRPTGLSRGHRSVSESDQRRALMLPQELMQLPPQDLIVLKAGIPAVRGRKIAYWRERAFAERLRPAPVVAALHPPEARDDPIDIDPSSPDPLTLDAIVPILAAEGLEPLPPAGASPDAIEAWVERFIDASAKRPDLENRHGR